MEGEGGYPPPIWPIRNCAAVQGMVFDLAVLNKLCNLT